MHRGQKSYTPTVFKSGSVGFAGRQVVVRAWSGSVLLRGNPKGPLTLKLDRVTRPF